MGLLTLILALWIAGNVAIVLFLGVVSAYKVSRRRLATRSQRRVLRTRPGLER